MIRRSAVRSPMLFAVAALVLGCESRPRDAGIERFRLPDADLAAAMKPAEFYGSPFGEVARREIEKSPLGAQAGKAKWGGAEPDTVELLTLSANTEKDTFLAALRAAQAIDPEEIRASITGELGVDLKKVGSVAGVDLYGIEDEDVAIAFLPPRIIAFGTVKELREALETGANVKGAPPHAGPASSLPDATLAAVLSPSAVSRILDMFGGGASQDGLERILVTADAADNLDVTVRFTMKSEADAAELQKKAEEGLKSAKEAVAGLKKQMGPVMGLTLVHVRKLLRGVEIVASGNGLDVTASVSPMVVTSATPLVMAFAMAADSTGRARQSSSQTTAIAALRVYISAQNQFHRTDFYGKGKLVYANPNDGAGFADLYRIGGPDSEGDELKLIDLAFARATSPENPRAGYYFVDVTHDAEGRPYNCAIDCGLCAVPARYSEGQRTYVIDVAGVIYSKDTGGAPVTRYPDVKDGWTPEGWD